MGFDVGAPALLGFNGGVSLSYVNYDEHFVVCPRISFSQMLSYTDKFDKKWDLDMFSIKYGLFLRFYNFGIIYDYGKKVKGNEDAPHVTQTFDFRFFFNKEMLRNPFIGISYMPYKKLNKNNKDVGVDMTTFAITVGAYGLDYGSR